ncbi:MAG: UDP-N-acetylmuramoyl-L-alanine--D-glutamate ligase [Alphaproteobacteria bacterium]|nr:UDP-N-acetylmuramoyl-L-alanine--D-glutamate ligase [Alphaproteobacteria bacterium]
MIEVAQFRNQTIAVLGLARSGLAAAVALKSGGAKVVAWDDAPGRRTEASRAGFDLVDLAADLAGAKALVLSPGIPHTFPQPHPAAARAKAAGVPIIGDIELLALAQKAARFAGVSGTNGKSTTTALIGHILAESGRKVAVGGNLGVPALRLEALGADGIYVLELSSYQLELTHSLVLDVAVLLNITPDHLDRHGGMDGYVAAKQRLFRGQAARHTAVVGVDDDICRGICTALVNANRQRVIPISGNRAVERGVYVANGMLVDDLDATARPVLSMTEAPRLPGMHNSQNAAAAYAAARALGCEPDAIVRAILTFPGLAHRQELIATIDGIRYVNDSKATNADAAEKALICYDDIYWIAGGRAKEDGIDALAPLFPRIRHAFLIGEAADRFARTLDGRVAHETSGTLDAAVAAARHAALNDRRRGAVVLLSPACASFDQFRDFEDRGDHFRRLVEKLPGRRA